DELVRRLHALGPKAVIVTGGHGDEAVDTLFDGAEVVHIPVPRYASGATHGAGCTHSATLAAYLASGPELEDAARTAARAAAAAERGGRPGRPVRGDGGDRWPVRRGRHDGGAPARPLRYGDRAVRPRPRARRRASRRQHRRDRAARRGRGGISGGPPPSPAAT